MKCAVSSRMRMTALAVVLGLITACAHVSPAPPAPQPESKTGEVGYPDVASARRALLARTDAHSYTTPDGWLVVEVPSEYALWSFTPPGDPADPSVVKRNVVTQDGNVYITMHVLCGASKEACDDLVRRFEALNEKTRQSLQQGSRQ